MPRPRGVGARVTRELMFDAITSRGATAAQVRERSGFSKQVVWLRLRELHAMDRIYIDRWKSWHTPVWACQVPGVPSEPDAPRPARMTAVQRTARYRETHRALVTAKRRKQDGCFPEVGMWSGLLK